MSKTVPLHQLNSKASRVGLTLFTQHSDVFLLFHTFATMLTASTPESTLAYHKIIPFHKMSLDDLCKWRHCEIKLWGTNPKAKQAILSSAISHSWSVQCYPEMKWYYTAGLHNWLVISMAGMEANTTWKRINLESGLSSCLIIMAIQQYLMGQKWSSECKKGMGAGLIAFQPG